MINWMCYPTNRTLDVVSKNVVEVFQIIADNVDSAKYQYESNHVLSEVSPLLAKEGVITKKSKKRRTRYTFRSAMVKWESFGCL